MAIRTIVKDGDPILNKVCRPVTKFDDRLVTLLDDMHETMIDADGIGLAAPQVGVMRQIFCIWNLPDDLPEELPADFEYEVIDFINPEFIYKSEETESAYEGCLSFPGKTGSVVRSLEVKIRAQDCDGEWFEFEADGLIARCLQHEYDHTQGVTLLQSSEYFAEDVEDEESEEEK